MPTQYPPKPDVLSPEEAAEFEWFPFDRKYDYWKAWYDVKTADGREIAWCWPNNDRMCPAYSRALLNDTERHREWTGWTRFDNIQIRLSKKHPLFGGRDDQVYPKYGV